MKITIGGDFCITSSFLEKNLFDPSIINLFGNSDYNVVNLECPVTKYEPACKIKKTGPNIQSDFQIFEKLESLNINAVTLANNHILDFGEKGVNDTICGCKERSIEYVGAGTNIVNASLPLFVEKDGLKIAFVNFCENEWSIATSNSAGANPLDIIDNVDQIKRAKQAADFLIVIVHGGHEYYRMPSPRMRKQYRFFVDNGADAVVGHHPHCYSGYEVYKNAPIIYSLGNMIFTHKSKYDSWYTGIITQLNIEKGQLINFNLIPISQNRQTFNLRTLEGKEKERVLKQMNELNLVISDPSALQESWDNFVEQKKEIIEIFSPINLIPGLYLRIILKKLGLNKILLKKRLLRYYLNIIRCEAHRDILIDTLTKRNK